MKMILSRFDFSWSSVKKFLLGYMITLALLILVFGLLSLATAFAVDAARQVSTAHAGLLVVALLVVLFLVTGHRLTDGRPQKYDKALQYVWCWVISFTLYLFNVNEASYTVMVLFPIIRNWRVLVPKPDAV